MKQGPKNGDANHNNVELIIIWREDQRHNGVFSFCFYVCLRIWMVSLRRFFTHIYFVSVAASLLEAGRGLSFVGSIVFSRGPVGRLPRDGSGPRAGVWRTLL